MKKRLLVIDDDAALSRVLMPFFGNLGWEAESVDNGEEGLKKALEFKPNVILLDVVLPDMEGWEVARRYREEEKGSQAVILLMSGERKESEHVVKGLQSGADDYISKPMRLNILKEKIEALVRIIP